MPNTGVEPPQLFGSLGVSEGMDVFAVFAVFRTDRGGSREVQDSCFAHDARRVLSGRRHGVRGSGRLPRRGKIRREQLQIPLQQMRQRRILTCPLKIENWSLQIGRW